MKQFLLGITLVASIFSCVPVATTSTTGNQSQLKYTDFDYSSRVGNVRITLKRPSLEYQNNTINLTKGEQSLISFDLLDAGYRYLHMKIFHCDWNWEKSKLNELEYLTEYNEFPINYYEFSQNNTSEFVSYSADLPRMTKSGNYIVAVYDTESNELLFSRRLLVYELATSIAADKVLSNGAQTRRTHQQIEFAIQYGKLPTSNPNQDFKTVLIQNKNWNTAKTNLIPTSTLIDQSLLKFDYFNQENNFPGLNNFRFFDARSLTYRGQNVFSIRQSQRGIEVILEEEKPTTNQAYSRPLEPNLYGGYYTRNRDPNSKDLNAEYVWVNFKLQTPKVDGQVYIAGNFNQWRLTESNHLKYNENSKSYEGTIWVKQGYYSYMYFLRSPNLPYYYFEGSHFETVNIYEVLCYYREPGTVFDRLVGYVKL